MSWYRTGTVTVTNGSPVVSGSGTSWLTAIASGWGFVGPDGRVYEVLSVGGNTSLTLGSNYTGTTAAGQAYAAYPTQSEIRQLATQVVALISDYAAVRDGAGAGKFGDGLAATPGISFASDADTGFYKYAANSIGAATGGVLRMIVNASGNVGIGTATPATPLDINHATDSRVRLMLGGTGVMQMQSVPGANRLASSTADPLELWTNGVRRALFDSAGRVGLGTGSPLCSFHIAGTSPIMMLDETGAAADGRKWRAYVGSGSFVIGTTNDANSAAEVGYRMTRSGTSVTGHLFSAAGAVALQVGPAGDVGVGPSLPQARLHVAAGGAAAKIRLQNTASGATTFGQSSEGLELIAASLNTTNKFTPGIKFGSTDPDFVTTNPKFGAAITAEAVVTYNSDSTGGMDLSFLTAPTAADGNTPAGVLLEALRIDARQNTILKANSVAPGLTNNNTMVFALTSNTNLRVSVRGSDDVTRVANITLT